METPCLIARCRTQPLWNSGGERPRWPSRGAPCFRFSSLHTQWLGRSCEGPDPPWLPITCRTVCPLLPTAAWTCPSTKLPPCPLLPLPFPPAPPPPCSSRARRARCSLRDMARTVPSAQHVLLPARLMAPSSTASRPLLRCPSSGGSSPPTSYLAPSPVSCCSMSHQCLQYVLCSHFSVVGPIH